MSTATTLLLNVAVGFLAAALVAPTAGGRPRPVHRDTAPGDGDDTTDDSRLDDFMMEKTQ